MRFGDPQFLWFYAGLPLLAAGVWLTYRQRRRQLGRFAGGAENLPRFNGAISPNLRAVKLLLFWFGMLCLVLALARPQWGSRVEPITRRGSDVVIVLDTSLSMAAEDLATTRLEQARHAIDMLLGKLEGDRVALVTFAGRASVICPLTLDHSAVRLFLGAMTTDTLQAPGSALGQALSVALDALETPNADTHDRGRAVVLFTDGEDHAGGLDEAVERADRQGVTIHAIGSGTVAGAPIPLRDGAGMLTGYKKDRQGRVVTTRLDEGKLERIALDTRGRYYRASAGELEVEEIARALTGLAEGDIGATLRRRYEERFQGPLFLAWLALLIDLLLGDRKRPEAVRRSRSGSRAEAA